MNSFSVFAPSAVLFVLTSIIASNVITLEEVQAYSYLLAYDGHEETFLRVIDGLNFTKQHQNYLTKGLHDSNIPLQTIWVNDDIFSSSAQQVRN